MNWIKDNLILLLAGLVVVLGLTLAFEELRHKARYAKLELTASTNATNFLNAVEANKSAQTAISELALANESLANQHKADEKAAGLAAERTTTRNADIDRQADANTVSRRMIALEKPNVASHLRIAVPCDIARGLWPEAGYCPN